MTQPIASASAIVITPSVLSQSMIDQLTADQGNLAQIEQQVSTGNRIISPSDDPSGASDMLQLQGAVTRANQYAANAADGASRLQLANSTVNSALSTLQSLQSTLNGLTGNLLTGSASVLQGTAQQVTGTLQSLVGLANTSYAGGQPIFAGTGNATEAYDATGTYVGAGSAPTRTVAPGTQVSAGTTGPQVFGTGSTGLLGQVPGSLGVLAQLVQDLQTGTPASLAAVISTDIPNFNTAITNMEGAAGALGAQQQSMQTFTVQAQQSSTAVEGQLSSIQSVNMAQALTDLQLQNSAYQSALYATSQIDANSLVKYL
ncbi:MAG TPA: flagellin [Acidimicrobiales bacterium]|nr:flagellin [Acidimicrobiales bacterium]